MLKSFGPVEAGTDAGIPPPPPEEWHPLSVAQRNFWFVYKLRPERRHTYNEAFCIRTVSEIDLAYLSRALNVLAARHSMLRVRFRERRQVISIAEADFHDPRSASPKERIKIQWLRFEGDAELWPQLNECTLLRRRQAAGARDE